MPCMTNVRVKNTFGKFSKFYAMLFSIKLYSAQSTTFTC